MLTCPFLIIVAGTGGLFVFKDDFVDLDRKHLVEVDSQNQSLAPIEDQIESVKRIHPTATIGLITLSGNSHRTTMIQYREPGKPFRIAFINPNDATYLGDDGLTLHPFWSTILTLHRNLLTGYFGRILVELTTGWCIVLVISGIYLWIPKTWRQKGVWWPRWKAHPYAVLRDWHTIPGVYLGLIAIVLCVTGLFFSPIWSEGYKQVTGPSGNYPLSFTTAPPATDTPLGHSIIPLSHAVKAAWERFPQHKLMILSPSKTTDPHAIIVNGNWGPTVVGFIAMDRTSGSVVADNRYEDLPFLSKIRLWVYPLHVGSVAGMPTKVIASLTCLMLVLASITGILMWLKRKRKGDWGFPHRPQNARIPLWGGATILALAVTMPAVGGSLILVLLIEWIYGKLTRTG